MSTQDDGPDADWVRGPGGTVRHRCPPDCDGGWRPVSHLYAAGVADPERDPDTYKAALNTVYPCAECRPEAYRLWSEGHTDPAHLSKGGCPECRPPRGGRR